MVIPMRDAKTSDRRSASGRRRGGVDAPIAKADGLPSRRAHGRKAGLKDQRYMEECGG